MAGEPTIVAMGGGGFQMDEEHSPLDGFVRELARARSGRDRPRVCYIPTAGADDAAEVVDFYAAYAPETEPSHLALFHRTARDVRSFLLGQDLIHIGGGNTANMLAIWRLHGVDTVLREAWQSGIVMSGMSAGAICWFEGCTTDSFGPDLSPLRDGLGILAGSFCPHYDGEAQRRPLFQRLVGDGTLPAGYAVDDGAALVFHGTRLAEVVTSRPAARAYRVEPSGDGTARETALDARRLGS
jgi:peptidase E